MMETPKNLAFSGAVSEDFAQTIPLTESTLNRRCSLSLDDDIKYDDLERPLPFAEAAQKHDLDALRQLIESGEDVNGEDWTGQCALYWAVTERWIEGVELLLKSGADPDGSFGMSPFVTAALFDRLDIMKLLLKFGADPKMLDRGDGSNALFGAAWRGNVEMFDWLISLGVDPNIREHEKGRTAYMGAIDKGHQEIIKRFEQLGIKYPYER